MIAFAPHTRSSSMHRVRIIFLAVLFLPLCSQAQECQSVERSFFEESTYFIFCDPTSGKVLNLCDEAALDAEPVSPCCTFNVALALMGFDAGILIDENTPSWTRQEGDDECSWVEPTRGPISPSQWIGQSCVWYSQLLARKLGISLIESYLSLFEYGNEDMRGNSGQQDGLSQAWLSSSLKVSPREQILLLNRLVSNQLAISSEAIEQTKRVMYIEELPQGWKLHGKTGSGTHQMAGKKVVKIGWFVGWIERGGIARTFVCQYRSADPAVVGGRIARAAAREWLIKWIADQPSPGPQSTLTSKHAGS